MSQELAWRAWRLAGGAKVPKAGIRLIIPTQMKPIADLLERLGLSALDVTEQAVWFFNIETKNVNGAPVLER